MSAIIHQFPMGEETREKDTSTNLKTPVKKFPQGPLMPSKQHLSATGLCVDAIDTDVSCTRVGPSCQEKFYLSITFFYLNSWHESEGEWKHCRLFSSQICHHSTELFEQLLLASSRGRNKCPSQKMFNGVGWVTRLRGRMKDGNLKNSAFNRK